MPVYLLARRHSQAIEQIVSISGPWQLQLSSGVHIFKRTPEISQRYEEHYELSSHALEIPSRSIRSTYQFLERLVSAQ